MSKLGGCVNEFELDLLKSRPLGAGKQGMSQSDDTLLCSWNGTLQANKRTRVNISSFVLCVTSA